MWTKVDLAKHSQRLQSNIIIHHHEHAVAENKTTRAARVNQNSKFAARQLDIFDYKNIDQVLLDKSQLAH